MLCLSVPLSLAKYMYPVRRILLVVCVLKRPRENSNAHRLTGSVGWMGLVGIVDT